MKWKDIKKIQIILENKFKAESDEREKNLDDHLEYFRLTMTTRLNICFLTRWILNIHRLCCNCSVVINVRDTRRYHPIRKSFKPCSRYIFYFIEIFLKVN